MTRVTWRNVVQRAAQSATLLGLVAASAPAAAAPFFSEILYNPGGASETGREWVELHNPDATDVDLSGYKLQSAPTRTFTLPAGTRITAGGYLLLAQTADLGGAFPCRVASVVWGTGSSVPSLGNSSGAVVTLLDAADAVVDSVSYIGGGFPTSTDGKAIAVSNVATGNDAAANWRLSDCLFRSTTDWGTPGLADAVCNNMPGTAPACILPPDAGPPDAAVADAARTDAATGLDAAVVDGSSAPDAGVADAAVPLPTSVLVSEVFYNPSGASESAREWVELFNPTQDPVTLAGWTLRTSATAAYVFPAGAVVPPASYVVVGQNVTLGGAFPCAVTPYAWGSNGPSLGNSSGAKVELLDTQMMVVDSVAYIGGGFPASSDGKSVAVASVLTGNNSAAGWRSSDCAFGPTNADFGTPGMPDSMCSGSTGPSPACVVLPDAGGGSSSSSSGGSGSSGVGDAGPRVDANGLLEPLDASAGGNNSAPTVTVNEPSAATSADVVTISWQATDPDGDVLSVSILRATLGNSTSGDELFSGLAAQGTQPWTTTGTTPGRFRILVRVDDGHGHVVTAAASGEVEVTSGGGAGLITVERPAGGEEVLDKVTISVRTSTPDGVISVFYDSDSLGSNGTAIGGGVRSKVGLTDITWNVTGVPAGEYFVYAVLEGAGPVPVSAYSRGAVTVGSANRCGCTSTAAGGMPDGLGMAATAALMGMRARLRRRGRRGH